MTRQPDRAPGRVGWGLVFGGSRILRRRRPDEPDGYRSGATGRDLW